MQERTEAIILNTAIYGENKWLITMFSQNFGKFKGMAKGSKKKIASFQHGNIVEVERFRRLESQLGTLNIELVSSPSATCLNNFTKLQVFNYITEILNNGLHEEEPHSSLYRATKNLLLTINQPGLWERLGFYELQLLASLGYGLSLSKDTAVMLEESEDNSPLMYISPKSGRAVTEVMGAPYKDKLLPLPELFGGKSKEFLDVFKVTGHFLEQAMQGKPTPARQELINLGVDNGFVG